MNVHKKPTQTPKENEKNKTKIKHQKMNFRGNNAD
jgi:hypothetical protein